MRDEILIQTLRELLSPLSIAGEQQPTSTVAALVDVDDAGTSGTSRIQRESLESPVREAEERLARELGALAAVARLQAENTEANTRAVIENSLTQINRSAASTAGSIGKSLLSFLGGGFGLFKAVGELLGGGEEKLPPPTSFALAPPVNYEGAVASFRPTGSPVWYGQDGLPRAAVASTPPQTNITVQVEAMDSRSFIDRSEEIALAVRRALLDSHSLSDVVVEL